MQWQLTSAALGAGYSSMCDSLDCSTGQRYPRIGGVTASNRHLWYDPVAGKRRSSARRPRGRSGPRPVVERSRLQGSPERHGAGGHRWVHRPELAGCDPGVS
jgi:hypothetical protein